MPNKIFTGAVDDSVVVSGNWNPSGVPADLDKIFLNGQAQQDLATGLQDATWQAKTVDIIVERSFVRKVGASGNAFTPGGIGSLIFSGTPSAECFFNTDDGAAAGGSDTMARVVIDANTQLKNVVTLTGNKVGRIISRKGHCTLASGVTVTDRISVSGGELLIPSGVTLTGVETKLADGKITCSSAIPVVVVDGGEFILAGVVGIGTYLEMSGGLFSWEADTTSIIALAEILGGNFVTRNERLGRTVTELNMYGDGGVDFRQGGLLITLTGGVRCFGNKRPIFPAGAKYTVAA